MAKRDENGRFVKGSEACHPAPKGNQYASKYKDKYCDDIIDFFSVEPIEVYTDNDGVQRMRPCVYPTMEKFAAQIGVIPETLIEWTKHHDRFRIAHAQALAMQRNILITNALAGGYNAQFAKFLASCTHGMVERTAVDVGNEGDKAFKVDITVVD